MRRLALLAAAVLLGAAAVPAGAHNPARLVMTAPAEGTRVVGATVDVVVEGRGGTAAALFKLDLDGQTVDATGRVGGVFATLSVEPGQRLELTVPVTPGPHTLTATPNPDADAKQVTVVRRFTVAAATGEPAGPDDDQGDDDDAGRRGAVVGFISGLVGASLAVWLRNRRRARGAT